MWPDLELWRTVMLYAVAIGQTLFVALYLTFPWYRSFLGRALFFKGLMLALLVDTGLFAREYPRLLAWDAVFVILYGLLALGVWFQFLAFLKVRAEGQHGRNEATR